MKQKETNKNNIWQIIWDIAKQVFAYIYDFLFNWEDEPFEDEAFLEDEKLKHSVAQINTAENQFAENNSTVSIKNQPTGKNSKDYEYLKGIFGKQTADYIVNTRQEVDYLVKEHNLIRKNTIMVVIPPEKMRTSLLGPEFFEATLEKLYSQFNKDVILKPRNIRVINAKGDALYAEIQIEAFSVNEEVISIS